MNIKVDFDNIVVKEDKNDFNVKVLMLKGEKGEAGATNWGAITGTLSNQTDLKNALDGKANQTDFNTVSGQVNTNTSNISTINGQITDINGELDDFEDLFYGNATVNDEDTSITLDNTVEAEFEEFNLKGNTSQSGTPTPSLPIPVNVVSGDNEITINSKNQLETYNVSGTYNGVSYTLQDGVLTLNGTCTASGGVTGLGIFRQSKGINYKWTYVYESGNCTDYGGGLFLGATPTSTTSAGYGAEFRTSQSRTVGTFNNGEEHVYYIYMTFNNGSTYTNYKVKPLIVQGDEYSYDFEPYQGDTYNIDLPVENLLSASEHLYGTSNGINTTYSDEKYNISGTASTSWAYIANNVPINLPAGTYTLSLTKTLPFRIYVTFTYDDNTTSTLAINSGSTSGSYTLTSQVVKYELSVSQMTSGTTYNETLGIQLEKGSKANSYTPYETTPIELCKIGNYQDYFYKDSGKWYLHKEIGKVVVTSFASKSGGTGNIAYYTKSISDILKPSGGNVKIGTYSSHFESKTANQIYTNNILGIGVNTTGALSFGFSLSSSLTTLELANAWVANNNIIVYYPLATPTGIEITYQPLIEQLNELEKAISYENQTNISQVNNDLPFIIYAEAFANTFNGRMEGMNYKIENCEVLENKVTSITSGSTDSEYPSAKAVYDLFNSITDGDEVSY